MTRFERLIKYEDLVQDDHLNTHRIICYCLPIKINRFESGAIKNFEIEQILDVAAFIKGSENVHERKIIFSPNDVPEEIRTRMSAIDQGLRDY
jgi:hypothetical protein